MFTRTFAVLSAACFGLCFGGMYATPAHADVILDTGVDMSEPSQWEILWATPIETPNNVTLGGAFSLTQPVTVSGIATYVGGVQHSGPLDLAIFNASDGLPDPNNMDPLVYGTVDVEGTGMQEAAIPNFHLAAGDYFVAAIPSGFRTGSGVFQVFLAQAATPLSSYANYFRGWRNEPFAQPNFRIDGVVPEPVELSLLVLGAACVLKRRRRT